jgi:hypothetical protein
MFWLNGCLGFEPRQQDESMRLLTDVGSESPYGVRVVHPGTDALLAQQDPTSDGGATSPVKERTQHPYPLDSFLSIRGDQVSDASRVTTRQRVESTYWIGSPNSSVGRGLTKRRPGLAKIAVLFETFIASLHSLSHRSRTLRYASRWLTSSVGLWDVAIRSL